MKNVKIILNRKNAINYALSKASKYDIVLVVGRGNEQYQIIGNKKIPFNDYEEIKKCLLNHQ